MWSKELPTTLTLSGIEILVFGETGTPNVDPWFSNFGASAIAYSTPSTSELGEASQTHQEPSNRYANNIPDGAIGGV